MSGIARHIPLFDMARFFSRAFILVLCVFVAGCVATKSIDRKPAQGTRGLDIDIESEEGEGAAYPEQIAGTVRQLYGEDSVAEQSQAHRDAIAENPRLRYIIIYFDFNQAEIKSESREVLMEHADYLSLNEDVEISLEGHADKRGSGGYNLALGERRALEVKDLLRANGVREEQLSAISYGEERPAVAGGNEESHAKNRRVELIY